jgi:PAS domain-containing protein
VLVFGAGGCRYASESVAQMLGRQDRELLGEEFAGFVHPDDLALVHAAYTHGEPAEIVFRLLPNRFGGWRHSRPT